MSWSKTLCDVWTGCRLSNVMMAVAMAALSCGVSSNWSMLASQFAVLMVASAFMVAGQALFNDVMDVEIDRVIKPWKPVASGRFRRRASFVASMAMTAAAVVLGATLGLAALGFFAVVAFALMAYSLWLKPFWGILANLVSSVVTTALCFVGCVTTGKFLDMSMVAVAVFFACLAREFVKDVEDFEGDSRFRHRSLPMMIGKRPTMLVALACVLVQVIASYIPFLAGVFGRDYAVVVTGCNCAYLGIVFGRRMFDPTTAPLLQRAMKLAMVGYLFAFYFG